MVSFSRSRRSVRRGASPRCRLFGQEQRPLAAVGLADEVAAPQLLGEPLPHRHGLAAGPDEHQRAPGPHQQIADPLAEDVAAEPRPIGRPRHDQRRAGRRGRGRRLCGRPAPAARGRGRHAIAELLHAQHQLARIDRLRDVVVGADAQSRQAIVDGAAPGQEHQRDAGRVGMRLQLPRGGEAVLVRHLDVEQDHRRARRLGLRQDLDALGDHRDLEAGAMQQPRHEEVLVFVVVGDEHRLPRLDRHRRQGRALGATLARSSAKALQISPRRRLAAGSSNGAPGSGVARASRAAACWATRRNWVAPARPTSRCAVCRRSASASPSPPPAVSIRTVSTSNRLGKAGDEAPAPLVDDLLHLSRRRGRARDGDGVWTPERSATGGSGRSWRGPAGPAPPRSSIG